MTRFRMTMGAASSAASRSQRLRLNIEKKVRRRRAFTVCRLARVAEHVAEPVAECWLGATDGKPPVEILTPRGRVPFPLAVGERPPFDHGLLRRSWLALEVERQLVAVRDGEWLSARAIARVWTVAPAYDAELVLVERDLGHGVDRLERSTVDLLDVEGVCHETVALPGWRPVG